MRRASALVLPILAVVATGCTSGAAETQTAVGEAPTGLTAEDRAEIRDLAGRYSHGLDLGEPDLWASVFTEDGVMEMDAQGYDITGDRRVALGAPRERSGGGSRHIPSTFVIEGDGQEATMRSYVTVVGMGETARITFQGRYEDRLLKVDGEWRIAHRKIITDWIDPDVAAAVASSSN